MSNQLYYWKNIPINAASSALPTRQSVLDHHEQLLNKFFDDFWGNRKTFIHSNSSYPKMDIFEDEFYFCIDCAVPGVKEEDLDVEIVKETRLLTVKGRSSILRANRYHDHIKELKHSFFSRTIQLPEYVELDADTVTLENGILYIAFKKIIELEEEPKTTVKKIEIKKR
jgi:HSP20 family protein